MDRNRNEKKIQKEIVSKLNDIIEGDIERALEKLSKEKKIIYTKISKCIKIVHLLKICLLQF